MEAGTYGATLKAEGVGKARMATLRRAVGAWIYGIFSDESLVCRARAGDHAAFDALVARYRERLHAMARASLGDMDQAAAALEEAMVAAYRDLGSSGRGCTPGLWLYLHTFRAVLGRMNVPPGAYTFGSSLGRDDTPHMPELRPAAPALAPMRAGPVSRAAGNGSGRIDGAHDRPALRRF